MNKRPRVRVSLPPTWGDGLLQCAEVGLAAFYPNSEIFDPKRAIEPAHRAVLRLRKAVEQSQRHGEARP